MAFVTYDSNHTEALSSERTASRLDLPSMAFVVSVAAAPPGQIRAPSTLASNPGSDRRFVPPPVGTVTPPDELPELEPLDEPLELPLEEPLELPLEEPLELPLEEPLELPLEDPLEEPLELPLDEPLELPVPVPVRGTIGGAAARVQSSPLSNPDSW